MLVDANVIENDVVVLDGRLADLIPDEDGNCDVYLNPADVEAFKASWCAGDVVDEIRPGRRIHPDPNLFPGRVRVLQGVDQIAMGSISNLAASPGP